jgi:hypothetical protein
MLLRPRAAVNAQMCDFSCFYPRVADRDGPVEAVNAQLCDLSFLFPSLADREGNNGACTSTYRLCMCSSRLRLCPRLCMGPPAAPWLGLCLQPTSSRRLQTCAFAWLAACAVSENQSNIYSVAMSCTVLRENTITPPYFGEIHRHTLIQ